MTSRTDIRASELAIQEIEDGEVAVTVHRADVRLLVLEHGSAAERPIVQLAFGALSGALAMWLLWRVSLFLWAGRASGGGWATLAGGGSIALIIAIALVRRALTRRYFVRATLASGTSRKLLLPPEWSAAERAALEVHLQALGWPVGARVVE